MADDATPAEVIEVVGSTGMHGEAMQVKCRILDGNNKGAHYHPQHGRAHPGRRRYHAP